MAGAILNRHRRSLSARRRIIVKNSPNCEFETIKAQWKRNKHSSRTTPRTLVGEPAQDVHSRERRRREARGEMSEGLLPNNFQETDRICSGSDEGFAGEK